MRLSIRLPITREEYLSLKAEWHYLCELQCEAQRLWWNLDFREGTAILDNNPKHIEQCKRLKVMARRRANRRGSKAYEVYEEMYQEYFDLAVIAGTPIPQFVPPQ